MKVTHPYEIPKPTNYWIDKATDALEGVTNDAQLARCLGVTRQSLSQHRSGKHAMSVLTAVKIAEALGINPMETICTAMYWQQRTDTGRNYWTHVYNASCHNRNGWSFRWKYQIKNTAKI